MDAYRCPSCGAVNRIRPEAAGAAAPGARPTCGRCHAALDTSGAPQPATGETLAAAVRSAPVPVLVDFWAPWCGPCRAAAPVFDALGRRRAGRLLVLKVNSDEEQQAAARHEIRAIPTFVLFRDGHEVARHSGLLTLDALERWVDAGEGGRPVA